MFANGRHGNTVHVAGKVEHGGVLAVEYLRPHEQSSTVVKAIPPAAVRELPPVRAVVENADDIRD